MRLKDNIKSIHLSVTKTDKPQEEQLTIIISHPEMTIEMVMEMLEIQVKSYYND